MSINLASKSILVLEIGQKKTTPEGVVFNKTINYFKRY